MVAWQFGLRTIAPVTGSHSYGEHDLLPAQYA